MNEPRDSSSTAAQAWVLRSRSLLEASAQRLDGATLSRLNRARQAALAQLAPARREPSPLLRWFGLGAVAAGLALVLWRGLLPIGDLGERLPAPLAGGDAPAVVAPTELPVAAPDFELLADPESYALLEDLEFYAWLQAEEGKDG
jgi:hypothetical protein